MHTKLLYGFGGLIIGGLIATIVFAVNTSNAYSNICRYQAQQMKKFPGSVGSFCAPGKICSAGGGVDTVQ